MSTILIASPKKINDKKSAYFNQRDMAKIRTVIRENGFAPVSLYLDNDDFSDMPGLADRILSNKPACVFNLFDGLADDSYREVEFVRLLEKHRIKYSGNSSRSLELCRDKSKVKNLLLKNRINVPAGICVKKINGRRLKDLSLPVFLKPCFEDGSEGIDRSSLVTDKQDLMPALKKKLKCFPQGIIAEQFVPGSEYQAAYIGKYPYQCLGVSVLSYDQDDKNENFLCYNSKWEEKTKKFRQLVPVIAEGLSPALRKKIVNIGAKAGKLLKCEGYFRVDMREDKGKLFVLDVNPNPDISRKSGFMRQAGAKGYTYETAIEKILKMGLKKQ